MMLTAIFFFVLGSINGLAWAKLARQLSKQELVHEWELRKLRENSARYYQFIDEAYWFHKFTPLKHLFKRWLHGEINPRIEQVRDDFAKEAAEFNWKTTSDRRSNTRFLN